MGVESSSRLIVDRFDGVALSVDPSDMAVSFSAQQVNCHSRRWGELSVRRGLRELEYESEV